MSGDKPQVLSERCSTCVFHPGNRMHLEDGRLADLVNRNISAGALLTCHSTLTYGQHPEHGEAICRGFWDGYRDKVAVTQVMERMFGPDWYVEVPPPG